MDGIEGMKIYNKIEVNSKFLPTNYPEKLEFVLTGVRHKLENNQWVTSLDSIATVNNLLTTTNLLNLIGGIIPGNDPVSKILDKAFNLGISKDQSTSKFNPDSNANELRKTIKSLPNTREKGIEIDNGGDITKNMQIAASAVLRKIAELYPSYKIKVTGGNDYHHQIKSPRSNHTYGQGVDFVIDGKYTTEQLDNIVNILKKFCVMNQGNTVFGYIDEYREPSSGASGKHFHIAIGNNTKSLSGTSIRVAEKAIQELGTKFVSMTEPYAPLSQAELQSLYSGYKLNFM